ncbi:Fc.00g001100.m01.CDS01 [Cosmosporella sp. VM-42]
MAKAVVILGAGWAGLPLAHKLLKYTVPKVSDLKVILVSPNSHFFWNVAATRGILPGEIPEDQLFLPIKPAFDHYSAENFEFVLGAAENIETTANLVYILTKEGTQRSIKYDQLVIATGSRLSSNLPLKSVGTHEATLSALKDLRKRIENARSIVIAGGGATGVEVAGELAAKYGSGKKITLVISGDKPLEGSLPSVQNVVDKDLQKLGIKLVHNARVKDVLVEETGKQTNVALSNGSTLLVDLYLPLHGVTVNTSFVPGDLLDSKCNLNLDKTMKVIDTENIWGIGDVGNIEPKQLTVTDNQIIHMAATLDTVLTGSGTVKPYEPMNKKMIFVSLGRKYATGQIGNWKLFGIMVSYVKGRKLFVDTAEGYVGGKYLRHAAM